MCLLHSYSRIQYVSHKTVIYFIYLRNCTDFIISFLDNRHSFANDNVCVCVYYYSNYHYMCVYNNLLIYINLNEFGVLSW